METLHIIMAVIFGGAFVICIACGIYFNTFDKGDEKKKNSGESSNGGFWKFILCIVLAIAVLCLIGMCGDGSPWSPRHT